MDFTHYFRKHPGPIKRGVNVLYPPSGHPSIVNHLFRTFPAPRPWAWFGGWPEKKPAGFVRPENMCSYRKMIAIQGMGVGGKNPVCFWHLNYIYKYTYIYICVCNWILPLVHGLLRAIFSCIVFVFLKLWHVQCQIVATSHDLISKRS